MIKRLFCKNVFVIVIILNIVIILDCSPIPLIQSPRIDSKMSISASIKSSGANNINSAEEKIKSKEKFFTDEKIPLFLILGIKKRVELSGMFFPYLWYGKMWQGNAKVALFEIGNKNFKNLASAIFSGTTGYTGEHEDVSNYYGGVSFGTVANLGISEFEFVLQSSISKEKSKSFEDSDHYNIYWLQPAFGILCKPGKRQIIQLNLGVNYSYPIKSDILWTYYNYPSAPEIRHSNTVKDGFSLLGELRFNIIR